MLAKVYSGALIGLNGRVIEVEVDKRGGVSRFVIVGLPDTAVQESRVRVRSAVRNSGMSFPMGSYTVNLAPADLPKRGPAYDLPIAVGVLAATQQIPEEAEAQNTPLNNYLLPWPGRLLPEDNLLTALQKLHRTRSESLPVFQGNTLLGLLSKKDVSEWLKKKG